MQATDKPRKAAERKAALQEFKVPPGKVVAELEQHILVDGFKLVFDLVRSHGSYFVDAATDRQLIDLYGFYASQPIGFNHPYFDRSEVKADLLAAAKVQGRSKVGKHLRLRSALLG
jgi:L-lysine 6-transaminase